MLKFVERSMWFFPPLFILLVFASFVKLVNDFNFMNGLLFLSLVYLVPPFLYRIIHFFFPIKEGKHKLGPEHEPSPWMISLRIQLFYEIFPVLERLLNTLPGIYSIWLRLWGSKIGRLIFWAPDVRILDRGHIEVGDRCYIGSSTLSCHLGNSKKGDTELYFKKIKIGDDVFIPAQCNIGPGSVIKSGEKLKIMTQILGTWRRELIS